MRKWVYSGLLVGAVAGSAILSSFPSHTRSPSDGANLRSAVAVIDGDTLEIDGETIQLSGIDTPEIGQSCLNGSNPWPCGLAAAEALSKKLALGDAPITCFPQKAAGDVPAAICRVGNEDIGEVLLRDGYAVALPGTAPTYGQAEQAARRMGLGLWRGDFIAPSKWRQGERLAGLPGRIRDACAVKGVIDGRNHRYYYVPLDREYATVEPDPARGGRFFCSDDEARLAGWARPTAGASNR